MAEEPLSSPALETQAQDIFHEVRCQVCAGQSIADSNAELARSMRISIREDIQKGQSKEAILTKLRNSYGDTILMKPPVNRLTLGLWLGPLTVLLLGGLACLLYFKKRPS